MDTIDENKKYCQNRNKKKTKKEKKEDNNNNNQVNMSKRIRRTNMEIEKAYQCPIQACLKKYGSNTSLAQHIKLKHNEIFKIYNQTVNNNIKKKMNQKIDYKEWKLQKIQSNQFRNKESKSRSSS